MPKLPRSIVTLSDAFKAGGKVKAFRGIVGDYIPDFISKEFTGTYFARHPAYATHWTHPGTTISNINSKGKPRLLMFEIGDMPKNLVGQDDLALSRGIRDMFHRSFSTIPNTRANRRYHKEGIGPEPKALLFEDVVKEPNTDFSLSYKQPDRETIRLNASASNRAEFPDHAKQITLLDDNVPHLWNASEALQHEVREAGNANKQSLRVVNKYLKKHGKYSKSFGEMIRNGGILGAAAMLKPSDND